MGQHQRPPGTSRSYSPGPQPGAAALQLMSSARPTRSPPASEKVHTAPDLPDRQQVCAVAPGHSTNQVTCLVGWLCLLEGEILTNDVEREVDS